MHYLTDYSKILYYLTNGEKTKFDVSFLVSEPTNSFCIDLNRKLSKYGNNEIVMGSESIIFPHISLFMGYIDSFEMLCEVSKVVESYAKETSPFTLDFDKLYFASVRPSSPKYVFVDSKQNDYLMEQKYTFHNQLQKLVIPIGWNMKDERAHISIACFKDIPNEVYKEASLPHDIPSCKISQIGISLTGSRGVCLGLLKAYTLTGKTTILN